VLFSAPNFSEGRDIARISVIRAALADRPGVEILDRHSDRDHHRTVFTLGGERRHLVEALVAGAQAAIAEIDMTRHRGLHPCVGALDVCPLVFLAAGGRAAAERAALSVADAIGDLGVPVFLYADLAASEDRRERSFFRNGGLEELGSRMADGELEPDRGPAVPHPTAGATLVTARPPLAAFNLELDTGDAVVAQRVATNLREAGGGLPGVRAIGLALENGRAQVSTNVHDPIAVPLAAVVERVRELAAVRGARPVEAELVGLAPAAALEGYPDDVPIRDFDPDRQLIERRLGDDDDG
jgi:glutamate formiminotransferase/glutamate formiminotransferase/formiminotetrahydrofolate cyclodeaminase